jgi:hypothetical protein
MTALNLISAITGILCSVAVTVATVIGLVPTFRHKAVRATIKMVDRHRAQLRIERIPVSPFVKPEDMVGYDE